MVVDFPFSSHPTRVNKANGKFPKVPGRHSPTIGNVNEEPSPTEFCDLTLTEHPQPAHHGATISHGGILPLSAAHHRLLRPVPERLPEIMGRELRRETRDLPELESPKAWAMARLSRGPRPRDWLPLHKHAPRRVALLRY